MAAAKKRFKQLLALMLVLTMVVLAMAFAWLASTGTALTVHFVIAVSVAVIGSLMLAAALMGLVFFSNSSGLDEDQNKSDSERF